MTLYDKILKIQTEYGLGAVDFMSTTGFSSGMYYDIKNGKKKKLSPVQASKLSGLFPKFTHEWLISDVELSRNNKNTSIDLKSSLDNSDFKEVAIIAYDNWDELMKERVFRAKFESEASQWALKKVMDSRNKKE